jgi:hypothetical protein
VPTLSCCQSVGYFRSRDQREVRFDYGSSQGGKWDYVVCSLSTEEVEQAVCGTAAVSARARMESIGSLRCYFASTGVGRQRGKTFGGAGEGEINCSCRAGVEILARRLSHRRARGAGVMGDSQLGPLLCLSGTPKRLRCDSRVAERGARARGMCSEGCFCTTGATGAAVEDLSRGAGGTVARLQQACTLSRSTSTSTSTATPSPRS